MHRTVVLWPDKSKAMMCKIAMLARIKLLLPLHVIAILLRLEDEFD